MQVNPLIIISKCLLGEKARFDGSIIENVHPKLKNLFENGKIISFCPELEGGLEVPRPACEIIGKGGGAAVIANKAKVIDTTGRNLSKEFIGGSQKGVEICKEQLVKLAILKERSPSCGSSIIYDGTFSGRRIKEMGVFTTILEKQGIKVFSEENIEEALFYYFSL